MSSLYQGLTWVFLFLVSLKIQRKKTMSFSSPCELFVHLFTWQPVIGLTLCQDQGDLGKH